MQTLGKKNLSKPNKRLLIRFQQKDVKLFLNLPVILAWYESNFSTGESIESDHIEEFNNFVDESSEFQGKQF